MTVSLFVENSKMIHFDPNSGILVIKIFNIFSFFFTKSNLVSQRSRWRPKNSRPFVHPLVTQFLENRSLLFSETLQLGRTWIGDKNVPSGFSKKILIPFNPLKMTKE